jgi:hypothetical protein
MTRSLRSMTAWAGDRPKDPVFLSRHNHLNDEIAALDDALAQDQKIVFSFPGTTLT